MSDHYGSRGKLTPAEVLREITGGEEPAGPDPLHGIPEAIGTSEDFPLTTRPGEYLAQPREPVPIPTIEPVDQSLPSDLQPPPKVELIIAGLTLIEDRLCKIARSSTPSVLGIRQCAEDLRTARKSLEDLL